MNSPRIALIVDHPIRDLAGLVLIARRLALAGAQVFLVPMYAQDKEVFALMPDLVLLNYLRKNNEQFVAKLKKSGIQYGILETEGGFFGDLSHYASIVSYQADLYQSLRFNLIWGQRMMDFWKNEFPHRQNLILTGLPRFDFYSEKLRNLNFNTLPNEVKNRSTILINTKVAIANPLFISLEKEIALYRDSLGMPEDKIQFYLKYGRFAIEDTVQAAKDLSQRFPESEIVIRPHPHENHKTYENALTDPAYKNVLIRRDGSVTPWILAVKAVIHRHCTTAIEAALAGKVAIAPQWMRTSADAPDAEAVSFRPKTKHETEELLAATLGNQDIPQPASIRTELDRIIDTWLYKFDGDSHVRAAQHILEGIGPRQVNEKQCKEFLFTNYANRKDLAGKAFHLLNQVSANTHAAPLWQLEKIRLQKWTNSQKFFTPEDCQSWSQALDEKEKKRFNFKWAASGGEYSWGYPGSAVKVSVI
jgi:surface carbohydrate biosynthesis protein